MKNWERIVKLLKLVFNPYNKIYSIQKNESSGPHLRPAERCIILKFFQTSVFDITWTEVSDRNVTAVCRCRYKCFAFLSSCPEPLNFFHQNLAQSILGWREFKYLNEWWCPFPRESITTFNQPACIYMYITLSKLVYC